MTVAAGAAMLRDAAKIIEERHKSYGPPAKNFENIARLWNAHLRSLPASDARSLSPTDVAIMMLLVKAARLSETPDHADSWTDIAGYAACGLEVAEASVKLDCGFFVVDGSKLTEDQRLQLENSRAVSPASKVGTLDDLKFNR